MARLAVVPALIVIGAAAPARAWCEATCLAPSKAGESHCPTQNTGSDGPTISANDLDQCPVLDSARPTAPARPAIDAAVVERYVPYPVAHSRSARPSGLSPRTTSVFERSTPLRI